jgi:hypothetical protein
MLQNYRRAYPPQIMLPATLQALGTDIAGSDGLGRRYLLAEKKKKNRWALAAGKAAGIGSRF